MAKNELSSKILIENRFKHIEIYRFINQIIASGFDCLFIKRFSKCGYSLFTGKCWKFLKLCGVFITNSLPLLQGALIAKAKIVIDI